MKSRLGVNVDHIATLRNARGEGHPDPISYARQVMNFGANSITIHLREDRRHIRDEDVAIFSKIKRVPINLEMAANNEMLKIALKYKPNFVCIVPEKRNEITTEGGLNIKKNKKIIKKVISQLNSKKMRMKRGDNSYFWGGAARTLFWVDPENDLVFVNMSQVLGSTRINNKVEKLVYKALGI